MAKYHMKDEFYHYWSNGQPYNQEYAVLDDGELDHLAEDWIESAESFKSSDED